VGGDSRDLARANSTSLPDFRKRCVEELEKLGDIARDSGKHSEAIGHYSNALLVDPTNNNILLKQSREVWSVFYVTSNGPH